MLRSLWRLRPQISSIGTRSARPQGALITSYKPAVQRSYASIAPALHERDAPRPPPPASTAMPDGAAHAPEAFGHFDLVRRFKLGFTDVEVSKWQSRVTGLSVVHLDYDAPIVNGYFVVATEIFDDTGCPHTLEHLVFLGSEKYPHKGIIDHLANRGFSNGTNAWTDTDHTAYTVSTAGEQGFLQLLPIYVDHILYPTITDAGYVTEVHHIDPKGHDSGVVYSEMQGRENTSGDLMQLRSQRLLNPTGSAYRSETGGLMEALRVLTVEQIRAYHGTYYVPHNLTLIVCGKLASGTSSVLRVVQEQVEPRIAAHKQDRGPRPAGWKRPFVDTASAARAPLKEGRTETVEFPEKDESVGELCMTFMGPPPTAFLERKALDVLGTYLSSSATAPLNKEYVEIESPLCTYIYFGEDTRATLVDLPVWVGSIPTEHLDTFEPRFRGSLRKIADDGVDMARMAMVIARDERQLRSKLESAKGDTFSSAVIDDVLYGPRDGSLLAQSMDEIAQYETLRGWTQTQWSDLLRRYFVDPPAIVVRGKPSAEMAKRIERDDKARLAAQVEQLGPAGLEAAAAKLAAAKAENDRPIPEDILTAFPVPDVRSISWIPVRSAQLPGAGKGSGRAAPHAAGEGAQELMRHIEADGEELPFFVQFDDVKTDFVTVHALFSLENLPDELRQYISTYQTAFFALPVKRASGEELSHEEVVNQLDDETVSYEINLGFGGQFSELARVSLKVEAARYGAAVAWLRDLLCGARFDRERLQVAVAKIAQALPELKRDGSTVLSAVGAEQLYTEKNTSTASSILTQIDFIPKIAERLKESPEEVIEKFEQIRTHMLNPAGVRFAVQGDIMSLKRPRGVWRDHFGDLLVASPLSPVPSIADTLSPLGKKPAKQAVVVSLPTIESSYVTHTAKGILGFEDPAYPAIRVAAEVLNATESYLWRYIRGSGLAYGASVSIEREAGFLSFSLYRSSNCMEAYKQAASVLRGLVDGTIAFDTTTLDAAKSSIVYGIAKAVSTPGRAAAMSFADQALKGVPLNHNMQLLEKLQAVTKADVLAALKEHFLPLFDPATSVATVVTSPGKADDIAAGLAEAGFEVEKRTLDIAVDEMDVDESGSEEGSESGSEESGSDMEIDEDDRR